MTARATRRLASGWCRWPDGRASDRIGSVTLVAVAISAAHGSSGVIAGSPPSSEPMFLTDFDGALFVSADDGMRGREL